MIVYYRQIYSLSIGSIPMVRERLNNWARSWYGNWAAYLAMQFISGHRCTAVTTDQLKNKYHITRH